jgi:hypothetical protein
LQAFASPWPPPSVVDIGVKSAPAKRKMDVRKSGEPRVRVRGLVVLDRQTPCKLHVPVFCSAEAIEKRFRRVMQCYILVRTSLATPPSLLPPASGRPSRWIHLLKAAGVVELPS